MNKYCLNHMEEQWICIFVLAYARSRFSHDVDIMLLQLDTPFLFALIISFLFTCNGCNKIPEPRHVKTNILHLRKQRRRSASR